MPTALIVDDESGARDLLAFTPVNEGWKTFAAGDGLAAFRLAKADQPGVVLLDLRMPGMSGEAQFTQCRQHPKTRSIPVIMLTAKGAPQSREAGLETGADDCVAKPRRLALSGSIAAL